jgi:hypothetical protein
MNKMLPSSMAVPAVDPIELQIIRQRLIAIPNLIEKKSREQRSVFWSRKRTTPLALSTPAGSW